MHRVYRAATTVFFCLIFMVDLAVAQLPNVAVDHVQAALVSQDTSAVPGEELWVAVRLQHDENWHTYWKNPGDAGMATSIDWQLPEGVTAGEIVWPLPRRFDLPAELVDFGYEDEVFLLTQLSLPPNLSGNDLDLAAEVRWLECEDETCIPNGAQVSLSLPLESSTSEDARWTEGFQATFAGQARSNIQLETGFTLVEGEIRLLVQATEAIFDGIESATFIPAEHRVFDYISEQNLTWQTSSLQLGQGYHRRLPENLPDAITGLLVVEQNGGEQVVYELQALPQNIDPALLAGLAGQQQVPAISLGLAFLFALAGGLILNLMPCVLPVLSLKVISVVESSGMTRTEQKNHALVYSAGVISSFLVLAGALLALQSGGAAIGWGFQMQSPVFVGFMAGLFLIMGLSMFGVIELGTSLMGIGSNLSIQSGYRGSFFTGVLTCVVASPCTMPFMGPALAVAFTQPATIGLTIFAALGLGVALPFLLIAWVPALAGLLPKPGQWMVTFKKLMALPLLAAAMWMLWVLSRQTGSGGVIAILVVSLALTAGLWLLQRGRFRSGATLLMGAGRVSVAAACVGAIALTQTSVLDSRELIADYGFAEPFSDARLAELLSEGRPVFVNMTASWCIPCLVNEKVALGSEVFEQALMEKGVVYLKGDWTNNDPEITAVLKRYNTAGVPLYLMFPAGSQAQPEQLPQVLTEGILLEALENI